MSARWYFNKFRPNDTVNDPIQRAFFSQELVGGNPAESLVREAIQNSLDARRSRSEAVTVSFTLRSGIRVHQLRCSTLTTRLAEHLGAAESGLDPGLNLGAPMRCIAIEDFGTTGLVGDPAQWNPISAELNPFLLFFRALGRSGKRGESRGRWGVGKFVFPLVSQANTWFGLTVPTDDHAPSLMGRTIIRTHAVGGETWHPDGYWGTREGPEELVVPIGPADAEFDAFRQDFHLKRDREAGFSVMVPWLRSDITGSAVREAVLREYFLPILRGELAVTIDDDGVRSVVTAQTVADEARALADRSVSDHVELAIEIMTMPDSRIIETLPADLLGSPIWDDGLLTEEQRAQLAASLSAGEAIAVRVPVTVRPRNGEGRKSHFDVFIKESDSAGSSVPLLIRQGVIISEAKLKRVEGHAVLVVADDEPLATLVGDAESPSHTQLLHEELTNKYVKGKMCLTLVREAPRGVLRAIASESVSDDPFLLSALFPINEQGDGAVDRPVRKRGRKSVKPIIQVKSPPRYRVYKISGGFTVRGIPEAIAIPDQLLVACAYEVRRGNPLKKYQPWDFSLADSSISIEADGLDVAERSDNQLRIVPRDAGFSLTVTGFDPNRNLFVRVS